MSRLLNRNFLNTAFNKNLTKNFYNIQSNNNNNSKILTYFNQNNKNYTPILYNSINNEKINHKINFYKTNIDILNNINNISENIKNNNSLLNNSLSNNSMKNFYINSVSERENFTKLYKLYNNYYWTSNKLTEQEKKLKCNNNKLFDDKISYEINNDFKNIKHDLINLKIDLNNLDNKINNENIDSKNLKICDNNHFKNFGILLLNVVEKTFFIFINKIIIILDSVESIIKDIGISLLDIIDTYIISFIDDYDIKLFIFISCFIYSLSSLLSYIIILINIKYMLNIY
mgnify:CR=1 FL=1